MDDKIRKLLVKYFHEMWESEDKELIVYIYVEEIAKRMAEEYRRGYEDGSRDEHGEL